MEADRRYLQAARCGDAPYYGQGHAEAYQHAGNYFGTALFGEQRLRVYDPEDEGVMGRGASEGPYPTLSTMDFIEAIETIDAIEAIDAIETIDAIDAIEAIETIDFIANKYINN